MTNGFEFGIEEEFFLVDAGTKCAARAMPSAFLKAAKRATGGSGQRRVVAVAGRDIDAPAH